MFNKRNSDTPVFLRSFSEEEFLREFRRDSTDEDHPRTSSLLAERERENFDDDPRSQVDESTQIESKDAIIVKIKLINEDARTIDVSILGDALVIYSHRYKCWTALNRDKRLKIKRVTWCARQDLLSVYLQ